MMLPSEHSNARFSVSKKSSPHFPSGSVWSGALSPRAYAHLHAGWHLYAAITCCGNNMNHGIAKRPAKIMIGTLSAHWTWFCNILVSMMCFSGFSPQLCAPILRDLCSPGCPGLLCLGEKVCSSRVSWLQSIYLHHSSSSNFLGVLPSYNKSETYYRLSSNCHLIIIIYYGLSIWNSTAWFPFSSFSSRIHPCAQVQLTMATSPESKFVDRFRQASWVPQMVTYGIDWHCGAPFLADFLFFLGRDAPYVFGWWQFLQVVFFPTCCWRWWKKDFGRRI